MYFAFSFCWHFVLFSVILEVEAVEATRWLKEAGFPQYAQMYEGKL